jgi:5-methylcytosine-specific restriction endonuclease McrA
VPKKINRPEICQGCEDLERRKTLSPEQLCKLCAKKESRRRWEEKNPGANAANSKKWRDAGNKTVRPEDYNEKEATRKRELYASDPEYRKRRKNSAYIWRNKNPEKAEENTRNWKQKNKDKVRGYVRKWNGNNKDKAKAIVIAWREANPHKQFIYADKRRNVKDNLTPEFLSNLMIWQQGVCFFCGEKITRENKMLDHIIPVELGGHSLEGNVVWSCSHCNCSRQEKLYGLEWEPSQENWEKLIPFKEEEKFFVLSSFYFSIFGSDKLKQLREVTEKPLFWILRLKKESQP